MGQFKAKFFRALGFTEANWEMLETELCQLVKKEAEIKEKIDYGQKYEIRGIIYGATGKTQALLSMKNSDVRTIEDTEILTVRTFNGA